MINIELKKSVSERHFYDFVFSVYFKNVHRLQKSKYERNKTYQFH